MTKYRIIPYPNKWEVQYKQNWFSLWKWYGHDGDYGISRYEFYRLKDAKEFIDNCILREMNNTPGKPIDYP